MAFTAPSILIAGGGMAGLTLALALKAARGPGLDITVADPALTPLPPGAKLRGAGRAHAVAASARRMFETLGVWPDVAANAQPITQMIVTDSSTRDVVRPVFLTFDQPEGGAPYAHMVESEAFTTALTARAYEAGVVLSPLSVTGFETGDHALTAQLSDGTSRRTALLVAADGARSKLRELAGIGWVGWDYQQSGLVATVRHARDHEGKAVEHFLPAGPFAILPLPARIGGDAALPHRSSIVWTERAGDAANLLAMDREDQLIELERRFGLQLGDIALDTPLAAYPLSFGVARNFISTRLALLGDAAHVIHPIAGQGLNLGFKDAAALAEGIVDACRLGLDPGNAGMLSVYERARRADTVAMGVVTDGLNKLFSNDLTPLRLMRDLGLGLVDRMPPLKRFFIGEAAGISGEPPRLMRGEQL
jgi:2-octaprenyl-6-methoxyphenol hydroxylase